MLRCPNCGAQYREGLLHCPYCRSVDDYQDESEYLENLDEIRDRLEDMPEELIRDQRKIQKREAVRDMKKIFLRVGLAAAVILLLIGAAAFYDNVVSGNSGEKRREKEREEYLWKQEYFPRLDELYEKADYEGLLELADSTDNRGIYDWEHYPVIDGLRILRYIPTQIRSLEEMENSGRTGSDLYGETRVSLLRDELEIRYFDRREVPEEDVQIIRDRSSECLRDLETRFALTPEEEAAFEKKAEEGKGSLYLSDCREFLKKR